MSVDLRLGDCLEILPTLPKVDAVITDPPYSSGGRNQSGGRNNYAKNESDLWCRDDEWFLGDNMGSDTYTRWQRQIARQCFDLATFGSPAFVFTDWRQFTNLVTAWESTRWTLRSVLSWDKNRGGAMGSFWRNNHEWVCIFVKGKPRKLPRGDYFNTWTQSKPQAGKHPTEKPLELMSYIASSVLPETTGGTILDPFMGSGTTGVACVQLNRNFIGIEIDPTYYAIAEKRIREAQMQMVMPLVLDEAINHDA